VLVGLENKWVEALAKSDTATLDAIFADTYVDTDEHSHRSDKQGVLAALKSGQLRIESVKLSNIKGVRLRRCGSCDGERCASRDFRRTGD
jgi:hypothetical protein